MEPIPSHPIFNANIIKNMENIIEKIEFCEASVEISLNWLMKSKNNVLNEVSSSEVIRFLLKEVMELKQKVRTIEFEQEQQGYIAMGDDL